MAKISDISGASNIWLGSKSNTQQGIVYIPASSVAGSGTADKPGLLFLEAVDSTGTMQDGLYLWADSSDKLRYSSTYPTDEDGSGDPLDNTATSAMVNKQLSNLGTVAINTSIQSDGDLADDLGDASYQWVSLYARDLYLNSTATMKGGTGGKINVVGIMEFGASGGDAGNADIVWHAHTDTNFITFDEDEEALTFEDDTILKFGTGNDIQFMSDGTDLTIVGRADDVKIISGVSQDIDWIWESKTGTGKDIGWVADIYTFQITDGTIFQIGGSAVDTITDGFQIIFDGSETLNIDPVSGHANDVVRIGESVVADFYLDGASYDINWDGSESELVFNDSAKLVFGGSAGAGTDDLIIASGGDVTNVTFGATTNSIVVQSYASQTVAALDFDNDTAEWAGANDVGLLHIRSDAALGNAGASLFYIDNSGKPIGSAEGFMVRWIDGSSNTSGTYAAEMFSNANHFLKIHTGAVGVTPLTITPHTAATAAGIFVDGTTGTWVGGTDIGLVDIDSDGSLVAGANLLRVDQAGAQAAASYVCELIASGTLANATEGNVLRIIDSGTPTTGTSYATYVNSTASNAMKLETAAAAKTALTIECATNATASGLIMDGTANNYLGGADTGLLHVMNDTVATDNASTLLFIDCAVQPKAGQTGACARFIQSTGNARTDGWLVEIAAITTGGALRVNTGIVTFDESLSVGTTLGVTGAATFALGQQTSATARTSNDTAGSGTSQIAAGEGYIAVTSSGDADDHIVLPAPVVGNVIWLYVGATGYELSVHATNCTTITLNGAAATSDHASSSVAANTLVRCVCPVANKWIATGYGTDGTEGPLEAATSCSAS